MKILADAQFRLLKSTCDFHFAAPWAGFVEASRNSIDHLLSNVSTCVSQMIFCMGTLNYTTGIFQSWLAFNPSSHIISGNDFHSCLAHCPQEKHLVANKSCVLEDEAFPVAHTGWGSSSQLLVFSEVLNIV